jgi:hypothetical protein
MTNSEYQSITASMPPGEWDAYSRFLDREASTMGLPDGDSFSPDQLDALITRWRGPRGVTTAAPVVTEPAYLSGMSSTDRGVAIGGYMQELADSHHYLDRIERRLGYTSPADESASYRLAYLEQTLATSVIMSRGAFALTIGGVLAIGIVIGILIQRRREATTQPYRRTF